MRIVFSTLDDLFRKYLKHKFRRRNEVEFADFIEQYRNRLKAKELHLELLD